MCVRSKHHLLGEPSVSRELLSYCNILAKLHLSVVSWVSLIILRKFTAAEPNLGVISVWPGPRYALQTTFCFQLWSVSLMCQTASIPNIFCPCFILHYRFTPIALTGLPELSPSSFLFYTVDCSARKGGEKGLERGSYHVPCNFKPALVCVLPNGLGYGVQQWKQNFYGT